MTRVGGADESTGHAAGDEDEQESAINFHFKASLIAGSPFESQNPRSRNHSPAVRRDRCRPDLLIGSGVATIETAAARSATLRMSRVSAFASRDGRSARQSATTRVANPKGASAGGSSGTAPPTVAADQDENQDSPFLFAR
jgi:hypothetical protein